MDNQTSQEVFQLAKKLPLEDFFAIFADFHSSLFRLECLPLYDVDEERIFFQEFLRGSAGPTRDFMAGWRQFLAAANAGGKKVERVRVFSEPRSDYERFEVEWCYRGNVECGEDIRQASAHLLHEVSQTLPVLKDFWLVDEGRCFFMEYDQAGRFLGISEVPVEWIDTYHRAAQKFWGSSTKITF